MFGENPVVTKNSSEEGCQTAGPAGRVHHTARPIAGNAKRVAIIRSDTLRDEFDTRVESRRKGILA